MLIHKLVLAIIWGPRVDEMEAEGRGSRNTNTQIINELNLFRVDIKDFKTEILSFRKILNKFNIFN